MLGDLWRWANEYAPAIYGTFSFCVLLLAFFSRQRALLIAGALLSLDWLTWNLTQIIWDYDRSTSLLPMEDAMYCGFMTLAWDRTGRLPSVALVSYLFVVAVIAWLAFIANHAQSTFICLLTANGIFFAQEATIGAASAWWAFQCRVADHARRGGLRPRDGLGTHRIHALDAMAHPDGQ